MTLRGIALTAISQADIRQLLENHTHESQTLEFKRESYGRSDEDIREMLRDISSMTNAFGGDLLLGVDEDEEGVAIALPGIDRSDEEAARIVSSCLSNIDERIPGLVTQPVLLRNSRQVLLIRVPKSHRGPHMITFKGLNQFWVRHDRQKSRMSIHEIKEACLRNEGAMERLEHFLDQRKTKIRKDLQNSRLIVSATPVFLTQEIVDIQDSVLRELLRNPPNQRPHRWNMQFGTVPMPSLYGLILQVPDFGELELFRNGHLELRIRNSITVDAKDGLTYLGDRAIIEYTVSMFRLAREIYKHIQLSEPVILSLTLHNIKNANLKRRPDTNPRFDRIFAWPDLDLALDPITVDSLEHPDNAAKRLLDRVWQAFGFEQAPLFDQEGNFTP